MTPKLVKAMIVRKPIASNRECMQLLDDVMRGPSTPERGKAVAKIANAVNYAAAIAELAIGEFKSKRKTGKRGAK